MSLWNTDNNLTSELDAAITKRYKEQEALVRDNKILITQIQQRQQELLTKIKEKLGQ